jgi:peptidoglycan/LPS O-acetylase OafA/YrhL
LLGFGTRALLVGRPLLALWLVVAITVLLVGNASTPYLRRLGRFGDVSDGVSVLTRFPVQQPLIWLFGDVFFWWTVLGMAVVTTFAMALASRHLVEKSALRFKPSPRADAHLFFGQGPAAPVPRFGRRHSFQID